MKKTILSHRIYLLSAIFPLFTACEKVIELDLDTQERELVVDAHIDWEKGTTGEAQTIELSYTLPYYSTQTPEGATGATITVTDDQGNVFPFLERSAGVYKNTHFSPALQREYQLSILYNGKRYEAADILKDCLLYTSDAAMLTLPIKITLYSVSKPLLMV